LAFWPELRLLAIFVSLLANICVLYHIFAENQEKLFLISKTSNRVPDARNSMWEKEIKNFEILDFCF